MFQPVSIYLGLRYAFYASKDRFISFISVSALLGLMLGVSILLTVCSVMNGFNETLHTQLSAQIQHIEVRPASDISPDFKKISDQIKSFKAIKSIAPFLKLQTILNHDAQMVPAYLIGIRASDFEHFNIPWVKDFKPFSIILDTQTRAHLHADSTTPITVVVPNHEPSMLTFTPRFKRFKPLDVVFKAAQYQPTTAYIRLQDAQRLQGNQPEWGGLSINLYHADQAPRIALELQNQLGPDWWVSDWSSRFQNFFKAIAMQKTMMALVLSLLICMAVFTLLSSLVMMVNDKQTEIAMMRTLGMPKSRIVLIFITQGMSIGLLGIMLGIGLGYFLSHHVDGLTHFFEHLLGRKLVSADVYWVDTLPSRFLVSDAYTIAVYTAMLCLISTVYPGYKAACLSPTDVLRAHR